MNNDIKLKVISVSGNSLDGYSQVFLDKPIFRAMLGANPVLPSQGVDSKDTNISMRKFEVEGTEIFTAFDLTSRRTSIYMKSEDAQKYLTPRVACPFSSDLIKKSVVATA